MLKCNADSVKKKRERYKELSGASQFRSLHERIRWKREDFAHKLSRRLVNEFGVIAFEDLNILAMIKNHCLAKSIADAAWNQLVQFTEALIGRG